MDQTTIEIQKKTIIPELTSCIVSKRSDLRRLRNRVVRQLLSVFRERTRSTIQAFLYVLKVKRKYQGVFGEAFIAKAANVDGRYFWRLGAPGFPSKASYRMHQNEANRFIPTSPYNGQRCVFMAITKKCPLNCEHCFEWPNLAKTESVSVEQWISLVHRYQKFGTTQIMLTGGEPMVRINDVYKILESAYDGTDFWIITSGVGLKKKQAQLLKGKGLTGIMVSIDHFDEARHDRFRGYTGAFQAAITALVEGKLAGLATTLSICATKEFTTVDNFHQYMEMAKRLGVAFVQIIEPRASGRYSGKDVNLTDDQILILEEIYQLYISSSEYQDYPIINYLGYHQRRVGCFGAADRFFYIDTDGDAHVCPFCTGKVLNTLENSAETVVDSVSTHSCHSYQEVNL
ncbi:MAG: radical SAM protein [Bacteroidota bacterium]